MDWSGIGTAFVGDCAAGLVVLSLGYWFVDRKLNLKERRDRADEAERERAANRRGVLRAVLGELHSNIAQWERVTPVIEKKEGMPFALFDVALWNVVAHAPVFATLAENTGTALIHAYNRMASANDHAKFLSDLGYGSTALLAHASLAGRMDDPQVEGVHEVYLRSVEQTRADLIDR